MPFNFLALPAELRDMILEMVMPKYVAVYDILNYDRERELCSLVALTQVSRQLRVESLQAYFSCTTFEISLHSEWGRDQASRWIESLSEEHAKAIRKCIIGGICTRGSGFYGVELILRPTKPHFTITSTHDLEEAPVATSSTTKAIISTWKSRLEVEEENTACVQMNHQLLKDLIRLAERLQY